MHDLSDANLVERSAQGDQAAFMELIRRYQHSLAALIRRLTTNTVEAEDLLQDTLLRCWLTIAGVRNPERVQAWLLQAARNRCRDHHKSAARREQATEQRELEGYLNRYGRAAAPQPSAEEVEEAVHSLSPAEEEVVRLFYLQGFTIREICARTRAPSGTIKSRLFTARHHLRSYFGLDNEEEGDNE